MVRRDHLATGGPGHEPRDMINPDLDACARRNTVPV